MHGLDTQAISVEEFWAYSLLFYTHNGNQPRLLDLQDNAGLNVNMLLFVFYSCTKNVFFSPDEIKEINQKNYNLDSLASNLRHRRRALKATNIQQGLIDYKTDEYSSLLAEELGVEKQQQSLIVTLARTFLEDMTPRVYQETVRELALLNLQTLVKSKMGNISVDALFEALLDEQKTVALIFNKSKL
jgi:uncharacterized protein (TIGR02444 family)